MKKKIILLSLVNAISIFSNTVTLDLNDVTQKALEKNKIIKNSELNLENAKLEKKQAIKGGLPSLSYSGANMHENENENETNKISILLNQNIFSGWKTITALKNADKYTDYYTYDLYSTKNSIYLDILNKYIFILKNEQQLEILKNSKEEIKNNYDRVKKQYELDLVSKTEVLDLNYSLISLETSILEIENTIEISKLSLKNSIGIPENIEIILKEISNLDVDLSSIDLESDMEKVSKNNLNVVKSKLQRELVEALEKTSKGSMFPSIDLNMAYGNNKPINGSISDALEKGNMGFSATLSISGTLFDWGKNIDSYTESKNNTQKAKYNEEITKENAILNVKKSYLEIVRLKKLLSANQKSQESANENYTYQKKRYENQLISTADFINAANNLRKSEIDLVNTKLTLYYEFQNYLTSLK